MFHSELIVAFCIFMPLCTMGSSIEKIAKAGQYTRSRASQNCNTEANHCHTGAPGEVCSDLPVCLGDCYDYQYCDDGEYAIGYAAKIQEDHCDGDCTGLNGVELYCGKIGGTPTKIITSGQQKWGDWQLPQFCSNSYINAYQVLYQDEIRGDNIASGTIAVWCSDANNTRLETSLKNRFPQTTWSQQRLCPQGHAVAGIRTQYERDEGPVGDDTALNNICFICTRV